MTQIPFSATTPVHVRKVGLKARDAERLAQFYRQMLGLKDRGQTDGVIGLGTEDRTLLEIRGDAGLRPDDTREAGLFHTAFLLPSRVDLARWVRHARDLRLPISGASDHLVSEAIYLDDPEGNGIEIYADRPQETWPRANGQIAMATERLDFDDLFAEPGAQQRYAGIPGHSVIGHVHLRVGDPASAQTWWRDEIGLDTMATYGHQAVFLASGGYHHHIGANSWRSAGATRRREELSGLDFIELAASAHHPVRYDPWGTEIRTAA